MTSIQPNPYAALEVVRLGRTEWRVSESSDAPGVAALLGYIERQRAGRYEIVWMTDPMRWGYTTTFDDALVAFGDSSRFTGEILTQRADEVEPRQFAGSAAPRRAVLPRRSTWIRSGGGSTSS